MAVVWEANCSDTGQETNSETVESIQITWEPPEVNAGWQNSVEETEKVQVPSK